MKFIRCLQGRAHRGLGGICRGEARAGCTEGRNAVGDRPARRFLCARKAQNEEKDRGKPLRRTVAVIKPEAQPVPHQDSRQIPRSGSDRRRRDAWHGPHSVPARTRTRSRTMSAGQGRRPLRIEAADGIGSSGVEQQTHGGHPVGEPPVVHGDLAPASGTVRLCTTRRSRARRAPACCQRWRSGLDELGAAEGRSTSCVSARAGALESCLR